MGWLRAERRCDTSNVGAAAGDWQGFRGVSAAPGVVLILAQVCRSAQRYSPLLPIRLCWLNILLYSVNHLGFNLFHIVSNSDNRHSSEGLISYLHVVL